MAAVFVVRTGENRHERSALYPCCYYWYQDGALKGVLTFHVDNLIMGGSAEFHECVLSKLRARFPFIHWSEGKATFLDRLLRQLHDYSMSVIRKSLLAKLPVFSSAESGGNRETRS